MSTKISIITVVRNNENSLEQTIHSIIRQLYKNIEYIIIDGNSTDNTVGIIKKYEKHINYWKSEPDNGIYNAMNKAISYVTGDWVLFLNAGDTLYDENTIEKIAFKLDSRYTICFGDYIMRYPSKNTYVTQKKLINIFGIYKVLCHQSLFYNLDKIGKDRLQYSEKYSLLSDFHFTLYSKQFDSIFYIKKVNIPVSYYLFGGVSHINKIRALKERKNILKEFVKHKLLLNWNLLSLNLKIIKTKITSIKVKIF